MTFVVAILSLGLVIFSHEAGHFIGARLGGLRVRQFALGYGWRLFGFKGPETEYRVNAVPFGGYVLVDGVDEETDGPARLDPHKLQNRPAWAQALFIISGPLFNFALAALLVFGTACAQGVPTGERVSIVQVAGGSPAQAAGIKPGDVIVFVNERAVHSPAEVIENVKGAKGFVSFVVSRGQTHVTLLTQPRDGRVGITLGSTTLYSRQGVTLSKLTGHTWHTLTQMTTSVAQAFAALFSGRVGLREFSGPVGMVTGVAATAATGWANLLWLLAFISVNLGLFNLLPIPALDGSRLVFLVLEKLFGLRLSQNRQAVIYLAGFAAIFALIIVVSVQDIVRLLH